MCGRGETTDGAFARAPLGARLLPRTLIFTNLCNQVTVPYALPENEYVAYGGACFRRKWKGGTVESLYVGRSSFGRHFGREGCGWKKGRRRVGMKWVLLGLLLAAPLPTLV